MNHDAFSAGVEPGGLWNKNDIRILLCYILASVNAPLARQDLTRIIQEKGLANYFEAEDALAWGQDFSAVLDYVEEHGIQAAGREIAHSLDATLPLSVRDKALKAAFTLLAHARAQRENRVDLRETEQGLQVTCHVSGGDTDLMTLSLYVPDKAQAEMVRECFFQDPEGLYQLVMATLTGDTALAREYFQEREHRS